MPSLLPLLGVLVTQAPLDLKGEWVGTVKADRAALMAKTKDPKWKDYPEYAKLMAYTIDRLEKSENRLTLNQGQFTRFFSDGYNPDTISQDGPWKQVGDTLLLGRGKYAQSLKLNAAGTEISGTVPGISKFFTVTYRRK